MHNKKDTHYDPVQDYSMKCRLYPTKMQAKAIDDALMGIRIFHNCLIYDIFNNGMHQIERIKTLKDGSKTDEKVHFIDLKSAMKAEYKANLIADHPIIEACPQGAITTNIGLKADLKREFGGNPIEYQKPKYYNDLHPRFSYTYQETAGKIKETTNQKVFMINLAKIGSVKVRGWNRKLRFDDENTDFLKWAVSNQKTKITVIVSKDEVGDYFIVFKIPKCLKPFPVATSGRVGIDVGVKDIAVLSSGQKYENRKYKKKEKRHQKLLNRKMSRRWGPANEEYRAARKKNGLARKAFFDAPIPNQKPPSQIHPSHGYMKARMQHAKLNRKIARKREFYNHVISRDIVEKNGFIAVETLTITNMVRNKRLAYALTDAAFGNLLSFIRYKAKWHKRIVQSVNKWTPSSKRCSNCGYIYNSHDDYGMKPWSLSIRNWTCPCCKTRHDRDINAAKNILYYVENQTFQAKPTT